MKTANRWAAIALAAVFLMTGGAFGWTAAAQGSTQSGEGSLTDIYERWSETASAKHVAAMDSIDADTLDDITQVVPQLGDKVFLEAIYRKANVVQEGFSAQEEQCLATLNKLSIQQLGALYNYWCFVMGEFQAVAGETDAADETAALIPGDVLEALSGSLSVGESGAAVNTTLPDTQTAQGSTQSGEGSLTDIYERWSETASAKHVAAMDSIDADTLDDITQVVPQLGDKVFLEAIYRKANVVQEGFSAQEEQCLATLNKLSIQQLGALYNYWRFVMGEFQAVAGETASAAQTAVPAPTATPKLVDVPTEPAPLTTEELQEVSDTVISNFSLDDEQLQKELSALFLSLTADDQTTVMNNVVNKLDDNGCAEFRTWMMGVFSSPCATEDQSATESLNLRGKDWNALTLPGLPAPARGKLQRTAAVDNKRSGRQTVLAGVTQEAFEAWLEQLSQEDAFAEWPDADGKDFDSNFGPSFSSGLTDSGGKATTVYCRQEGANGNVDIRIDYLYTDQTLSVTVLEP